MFEDMLQIEEINCDKFVALSIILRKLQEVRSTTEVFLK